MQLAGFAANRRDLVFDLGQFSRAQDFVWRSQIGAPEDVEILLGKTGKGLHAV